MARVHDSIDVAASCEVVFDHLARFEEYPRFMAGVAEVRRTGRGRLHWNAQQNGRAEQWEAEIVESIPPHRLGWSGAGRAGLITCRGTPWGKTRVFFDMDQEPLQPTVDARHYLEATRRRMRADLENFREYVEGRAAADEAGGVSAGRKGTVLPAGASVEQ